MKLRNAKTEQILIIACVAVLAAAVIYDAVIGICNKSDYAPVEQSITKAATQAAVSVESDLDESRNSDIDSLEKTDALEISDTSEASDNIDSDNTSSSVINADDEDSNSDVSAVVASPSAVVTSTPIILSTTELNSFLSISKLDNGIFRLTNTLDGYTIDLPRDPQISFPYPTVRTEIDLDGASLYIYAERFRNASYAANYSSYSNRFLSDTVNFRDVRSESFTSGKYKCNYASWTRDKLSKVQGDKNFYICLDLASGGNVYTLYFKSEEAITKDYALAIAETLTEISVSSKTPAIKLGTGSSTASLSPEALDAYNRLFSDDASLSWGIFDTRLLNNRTAMDQLEESFDYRFGIYLWYTGFLAGSTATYFNRPLGQLLNDVAPDGQTIELTLQTKSRSDGKNMILCTLNGEYDSFLHDYAKSVANYKNPVLFRLCNEMNGDWCVYCAFHFGRDTDLYNEFYRYVYNIFQEEGADNAIWVWNPNTGSFPNYKWNSELMYYPGDAYAQVVGMTAYNTGTYYSSEKWSTFSELYDGLYARYTKTFTQPLMITEFACSGIGGDKAAWIDDMFEKISAMPRIKLAIWWNGRDYDTSLESKPVSRPYALSDDDGSLEAFGRGLHR